MIPELTIIRSVPTFKLILNANTPIPLVLKDSNNMKGVSFTDIYADKSLDGRAGTFYLLEDAVRIVSTFSGLGSARVVPDSSADDDHKTQFDVFQQRLHSGQTVSNYIYVWLFSLTYFIFNSVRYQGRERIARLF